MAIVVANMIGTGVFTSLGFQLNDLNNPYAILLLWGIGGVLALSGAFSYAEIGTHIQRSGGEYAFLTAMFNPLIGYLAGWVSITVGFAAPVALAAIACIEYFPYLQINPKGVGILLVGIITMIHTKNLRISSLFQNVSTVFKIILVVALIGLGLILRGTSDDFSQEKYFFTEVMSPAFAVALIYVSYSYSGWNAAAYITEEFENPRRSLPRALIVGTLIVTVLYVLLQYVFLKHVPIAELRGQLDVGRIAVHKMIGADIGKYFGLAISLLLVSGVSAMVWVGPRVTASIGKEHALWKYFSKEEQNVPARALWLQFALTSILLITGTFEQILIYCGVLLTLSSMMTVAGGIILRVQNEKGSSDAYKSPFSPLFHIIFIILALWMVIYAFVDKPFESMAGLGNLILGGITFWVSNRTKNK